MQQKYKRILAVLSPFSRLHWQLLISIGLAVLAAIYVANTSIVDQEKSLAQPSQILSVLGVIGAILAIASSISYGHLVQFIGEARHDLYNSYHRFKDGIFSLYELISHLPSDSPVVPKANDLAFKMHSLRLNDIPFGDEWDDAVQPVMAELDKLRNGAPLDDDHLKLVGRIIYCEELLSEVGVASIKQIVSRIFIRPVAKSLALLVGILIAAIGGYFLVPAIDVKPLVAAVPVFFGCFASLIFIETGYYVYRYTYEFSNEHVADSEIEQEEETEAT